MKLKSTIRCLQLIMRISICYIILLTGSMQLLLAGHISGQSVNDVYMSINVQNSPLRDVLSTVEGSTDFVFAYQDFIVETPERFNFHYERISVGKFLTEIANLTGLSFYQRNNTISITQGKKIRSSKEASILMAVSGKVTSTEGEALPGVNVVEKGATNGTVTDIDGNYKLDVVEDAILIFSFIGYKTQEVPVNGRNVVDISLEDNVANLSEVVINAGYYSTTERLKTGNISKISSQELSKTPVANPMGALQGRVPGMLITQSSGNPGAAFEVEIRGRTQFDKNYGASDEPLYIIDNVPIASGNENLNQLPSAISAVSLSGLSPLYTINPADIESIEILKDADATAIYGSRGASGVILITTKKGSVGAPKFNISVSSGSSVAPLPEMLNTKQYVTMRKEALLNDGLDLETMANSASSSTRNKVYDLAQYDTLRDNNLTKQLLGGTASTTDVQASLSGGSELTQLMLAGGYHRETSVTPGDLPNYRASGRFNVKTTTPNRKFTGNFTASYSATLNTSTASDLSLYLTLLPPNYNLYEDNGDLAWNEGGYKSNNPLAYTLRKYEANTKSLNTNAYLSYKLLPGLIIKSSIGYNTITVDENRILPSISINPLDRTGADGQYLFGHRTFKSWIFEPQMDYEKILGSSTINLLIGGSFQNQENKGYNISIAGYEDDNLIGTLSVVTPDMFRAPSSNFSKYTYGAFFGRVNYNYDGKYILNLSGRRDGSSRFGPDFRFSNFGAVGAAWIISKERFLESLSFISFVKLRASYGVTGNDKIGEYKYQDYYESGFSTNSYDGDAALTPSSLFNADLHWEKNIKTEIALDLNVLSDRLKFSASWYQNNSSDPLVSYQLPEMTGFSSVVNNLSDVLVQNRGLELVLNSTNIQGKDFRWSTNFNITIPNNKLVRFPNFEESSYTGSYVIGQSLNTVIAGHVLGVNPETGLYTLEDYNNNEVYDATVTDGDFKPLLDTDPDFYGGLQNSVSYKGITLDFLFQFSKKLGTSWLGSYGSITSPVGSPGYNFPTIVLDRWQQPGDITDIQKFTTSASFLDLYKLEGYVPAFFSDLRYTDVSFVRLKNVSLSYDFPEKILKEIGIPSLRIYTQAHNLLTFTPYEAGDPETALLSRLAPLRTIIFGVQISL